MSTLPCPSHAFVVLLVAEIAWQDTLIEVWCIDGPWLQHIRVAKQMSDRALFVNLIDEQVEPSGGDLVMQEMRRS